MGALLSTWKKAIIEDMICSISSNSHYYYAFASNPVTNSGNTTLVEDLLHTSHLTDWQMLFGKKITNTDVIPVIKNIQWTANTVYTRYDNNNANLYSEEYYVITAPEDLGGDFCVYMCLDNANNSNSIYQPDTVQETSFTKADGYTWRYITSISSETYNKFYTNGYAPLEVNTAMQPGAAFYSGIDVVVVANGGSDYKTYANGTVLSTPQANLIQLSANGSSLIPNFYVNCSIYLYTSGYPTTELKKITGYVSNSSGYWVSLDSDANTNNIIPTQTQYYISPMLVFDTDGNWDPEGYVVINPASNTVDSIVITDPGADISRANVSILPTMFGSGANIYPILPPPGGYGFDPATQLNVLGLGISFKFANTENGNIPVDILYNKIGIIKDPYELDIDGTKTALPWSNNIFSAITKVDVSPAQTYTVGDYIYGNTSYAVGQVVFSNSTVLYLVGDKAFSNNEYVANSSGAATQITINTLGDIYTKDLEPLYIQSLTDVTRSNTQTETYKLIIQI